MLIIIFMGDLGVKITPRFWELQRHSYFFSDKVHNCLVVNTTVKLSWSQS